ncbi:unnamed protein product [Hydatigera taeniaeformis]|uniref:Protein YIPF n=1 Tax=Hydatigena taeniaeformis TaxID=6205 RepID=A0A0R3X5P6_HYDTA|nr:unnamed protein product [Hydatigera taeniaeformis]
MSGIYVPVPLEPQPEVSSLSDTVEGSSQVVQRMFGGLIPFSKRFSLSVSLRPAPDLYGPFWIIVTLVFSIAFSGSIYEYMISKNASALSTFNFGRATISAAILFVYWCLVPIILTSLTWFRGRNAYSDAQGTGKVPEFSFGSLFSVLLAIYGYSMVSFIPVAAAIGLLVLIVIAHIAMTASLFVVFFHQPPLEPKPDLGVQASDANALNNPTLQETIRAGVAGDQKDASPKEAPIKPAKDIAEKKAEKDNPKSD